MWVGVEVDRRNPWPLRSCLWLDLCSPLREEMREGGEEGQVLSRGEVGL